MGFHPGPRPRPGRRLPGELVPVVTPGEYSAALARAIGAIMADAEHRGEAYRRAVHALAAGRPDIAVRALSRFTAERPGDRVTHRTLGVAQLHAGNLGGAAWHLEISLGLSRGGAILAPGLERSLRAHLDGALARLVLLLIHARLGRREAAQRLALDGMLL